MARKKTENPAAPENTKPRRTSSKYDPGLCERLIDHMAQGGSYEGFAGKISVARATLYNWEAQFPEWAEAKEIGEAKSRLWWDEIALRAVQGGIEYFNATVYVFTMKNRFGWRDKQDIEHSGSIDIAERLKKARERARQPD